VKNTQQYDRASFAIFLASSGIGMGRWGFNMIITAKYYPTVDKYIALVSGKNAEHLKRIFPSLAEVLLHQEFTLVE